MYDNVPTFDKYKITKVKKQIVGILRNEKVH